MDIGTQNAEQIVNVGSAVNLYSLYSTATTLMGRQKRKVALGLKFLENGSCEARNCAKTARQLEEIDEVLAKHDPSVAIWDMKHPNIVAPWVENLASDVNNCSELYTTSEGNLLIPELIRLLRYAEDSKQNVLIIG